MFAWVLNTHIFEVSDKQTRTMSCTSLVLILLTLNIFCTLVFMHFSHMWHRFQIGWLSKNVSHHGRPTTKNLKKTLAKTPKTFFSLQIFRQTCFCLVSENTFAEMVQYHFLTPKNCSNSWNTLKANVCIFLHISARKCLFQWSSKIWWAGAWVGGG